MVKIKRKKGRGFLIAFIILILLAAAIWFIGIPFANHKAEDLVDKAIQERMSVAGFPLEYSGITIQATKGQIEMSAVEMPLDGGAVLTADRLQVKVSPQELIALALGKGAGLTTATVSADMFTFHDTQMSLDFAAANIAIEGNIDVSFPEDSIIRKIDLDAKDVHYSVKDSPSIAAKGLELAIKGNLTSATLQKDLNGILDDLRYIDVKATGGAISPDAATIEQLGMLAVVSPWIADTNNWKFDSLAVEARSLEDAVMLDSFALVAPLMEATGTATLPRGDSHSVSMKLDIEKLHSQVRSELAPIALFMGHAIPEKAFGFDFAWDGEGMPGFDFY